MELYGSLHNISGSVTASAFTGSFIGDGSGLTGIQASGVTGLNLSQISNGDATASISTSGFTVNKNTQIQGNLSVTGALIATEYIVSSSVTYMTTSFASGSSAFGNDNNDVHQFTGSVQITGSISLNGQAIGTGKLDETTFQSYTSSNNSIVSSLETSSGSLNSFTSSINTTIKSKLDADNVISGSIQVVLTGTTGYSTFSSSISTSIADISSSVATTTSGLSSSIGSLSSSVATTDLNQTNRLVAIENTTSSLNNFSASINTTIKDKLNLDGVISGSVQILNGSNIVSSSAQVTAYGFATTGSNLFKGTQTLSGSILPSVDNTYDLGSPDYQWRDVYISSGSLYIDGTKVLSSTTQELTITTDNGQSIKILESGTDSIILQTADGDIELKSNADGDILLDPTNGKILLKGTVEVLSGNKIQSSVGGTPIVFANDIVVSGSIDITGTIEGINLTDFSSSVNNRINNLESSSGSLNSFTSSANSRLNSLESTTGSLNSYTSSNNTRLGNIEGTTGSLNSYTSSNTTNINSIHTATSSLNSYTSSNTTNINAIHTATSSLNSYTASNNTRLGIIETSTGSINTFTSSANSRLSSIETTTGSIIGVNTTQNSRLDSLETTSGSILTTNTAQSGRLDSIEGKTGSYATTGSNIFIGNQTITGSLYVSQDLIIAGSSSIQHISSSVVNIADNIITVNAVNPSVRFGGLAVIDSGSSPTVSGSMLFDSVNNQWLFVHQNQGTVTSSVLLMGPETYNNIGNETYITANRLVKSTGIEHLTNSNISDDGTTVTILSNTIINGTISATGTTIVSGSSQISHDSTTGYVANRHIDHTSVSISAGNGLSGGGDISATRTLTLDTASATFTSGVKSKMNTDGVISGSAQVVAALPSGTVSGSSQVLSGTGIWSGSAQLPSGVVSGSSQVLAGTTIHSGAFFNGISVVSGSGQISFNGITDKPTLVSGSSQVSFNGIVDKPALVSGSSQITYSGISSIPSGIVSGSSQITYSGISSIPSGIVSGSSQITFGNISSIPSGLVSGSSQISFGSISSIPSGLVSGSAQVSIASTTGFSTYLDQAVKSGSTVTFNGITNTSTYSGSNIIYSTYNTATGRSNLGFSVAKTTIGNIHIQNGSGAGNDNSNQAAITFQGGSSSEAQAGIYVLNNSSYGTSMGFATTNSYASGPQLFMTATNGGVVDFPRARPTYAGNVILDAANYTSYAMAGAGYSANQNLNTSSAVTFAGITNNSTYSGSGGSFSHNLGNPAGTTELFVHNGANTPVPFRMTKAGYSGAGGSYGILQLYMNDNTVGNGANLYFCANNSSGTFYEYGGIGMQIKSSTASGESARLYFYRQNRTVSGTFDSNGDLYTVGNIYTNGNGTTTGNLVLNSSNFTSYAYSTSSADSKFLIGTTNPGSVGNFTISIGNNGTYSYVQSHSSQPLELNPVGNTVRIAGNVALHAGNYTSYAMAGAGYSANQNLNTSNTPTFAGADLTGRLYLNGGSYEGSILFGSSTTWRCGIRQHDDADAELRIWTVNNNGMIFLANGYNGEPADIARPTDGLVVGPANNVGIGNFSAGDPSYKLHVKGTGGFEDDLTITNANDDGLRLEGTAPTITFKDTDNRTGYIHVNSDWFYVLTGPGGATDAGWSIAANSRWPFRVNLANNNAEFGGDINTITLTTTGNATIGGTLTENSSIRYKKDIETISYGLDKVLQMRGVTYLKKENDIKEVGVIAEEIAEILPELVNYDTEGRPDSVSYGRITALLIEAIKDLKKEINELKNNG